jgi:hypothetical protein
MVHSAALRQLQGRRFQGGLAACIAIGFSCRAGATRKSEVFPGSRLVLSDLQMIPKCYGYAPFVLKGLGDDNAITAHVLDQFVFEASRCLGC